MSGSIGKNVVAHKVDAALVALNRPGFRGGRLV